MNIAAEADGEGPIRVYLSTFRAKDGVGIITGHFYFNFLIF